MQQADQPQLVSSAHNHETATKRSIDSVVWSGLAKLRRGQLLCFTDVKLHNQLVLKYVSEIYTQYQIPDPLGSDYLTTSLMQTPSDSRKHKLAISQTTPLSRRSLGWGSRIDQMKKSMRDELERTAIESYHGVSRLEGIREDQSYDDGSEAHRQEYSIVDYSRFQPPMRASKELAGQLSVETPRHYFRLCVICQSMIEEHNLVQHERECEGYQTLYSMTGEQISEYLTSKITRLEETLLGVLNEEEHFDRESIQHFLAEVNSPSPVDIETSHDRMVKALPTKTLSVLEISYKLKWLRKVLEQVRARSLLEGVR